LGEGNFDQCGYALDVDCADAAIAERVREALTVALPDGAVLE
jgi:hypothetical protein